MFLRIAGAVLFVILFNALALGVMLLVPPWYGLAWGLALGALFLWWHLRAGAGALQRRELIRIRQPRVPVRWLALASFSTIAALFGLAGAIGLTSRPISAEDMRGWKLLVDYQKTVPGWIALTAVIALVIPVVEEFNFRGRVQHALERRYSIQLAIATTTLLFTITHIGVPRSAILLIPLALGLANGLSVILFNSIWGAVATHTLWNALMAGLGAVSPDNPPAFSGLNENAGLAASGLLIVTGAVGWYLTARASRQPSWRSDVVIPVAEDSATDAST